MWTTGWVYMRLGGAWAPSSFESLPRPLVGAIAAYFFVNTGLVAYAIASSTRQRFWKIWHDDFLWSGASFIVAGTVGGVAAVVIANGEQWMGLLLMAPIYFVYRTYHTIVGRLDDQRRHLEETRRPARGDHRRAGPGAARRAGADRREGAARGHAAAASPTA